MELTDQQRRQFLPFFESVQAFERAAMEVMDFISRTNPMPGVLIYRGDRNVFREEVQNALSDLFNRDITIEVIENLARRGVPHSNIVGHQSKTVMQLLPETVSDMLYALRTNYGRNPEWAASFSKLLMAYSEMIWVGATILKYSPTTKDGKVDPTTKNRILGFLPQGYQEISNRVVQPTVDFRPSVYGPPLKGKTGDETSALDNVQLIGEQLAQLREDLNQLRLDFTTGTPSQDFLKQIDKIKENMEDLTKRLQAEKEKIAVEGNAYDSKSYAGKKHERDEEEKEMSKARDEYMRRNEETT